MLRRSDGELEMAASEGDREQKIRARARRLWRAEGAPKGRLSEYIERARELVAIEEHPAAALLPNPMTQPGERPPGAEPVEEAPIMENLGEFPGRLTDQGDRAPVLVARKKAARAAARQLRRGERTIDPKSAKWREQRIRDHRGLHGPGGLFSMF